MLVRYGCVWPAPHDMGQDYSRSHGGGQGLMTAAATITETTKFHLG